MDPRFAALTDRLAPKLKKLLAMKPLRYGELPLDMPEKGIYLFSRGKKHLYIGRSNVLRKRFEQRVVHPGRTDIEPQREVWVGEPEPVDEGR
jgi:hypothetical protein